jgi:acyl dehydratase
MATTFESPQDFFGKVGEDLGTSEWIEVTQEKIDKFAEATGDHQWIHVNPEMAAKGPFGTTIAHGYLTLALAPVLMASVVNNSGAKMGVNYGLNKVRFTSPVKAGKRVRMSAKLAEAEKVEPNGVQATYDLTFEIEGEEKPAAVAQTIFRAYF